MTTSVENYIKTIYRQSKHPNADTRLSTIASILHISNAAATDMAKKLAKKNLVNYVKYKPLSLTNQGIEQATGIIRKHRLWESFLYQTLHLSLHQIHQEAEYLGHNTSDFLADTIDRYLNFPSTDPHGDPIPDSNGNIVLNPLQHLLADAAEGHWYEIKRLYTSDKEILDFCTHNHLLTGAVIWLEKHYPSNKMTEIQINQSKILISDQIRNILYVEQTQA